MTLAAGHSAGTSRAALHTPVETPATPIRLLPSGVARRFHEGKEGEGPDEHSGHPNSCVVELNEPRYAFVDAGQPHVVGFVSQVFGDGVPEHLHLMDRLLVEAAGQVHPGLELHE
eukprot:2580055-Rhodomonas_salina.1